MLESVTTPLLPIRDEARRVTFPDLARSKRKVLRATVEEAQILFVRDRAGEDFAVVLSLAKYREVTAELQKGRGA